MGNKRFTFYCAYIDPDEIKNKTPAKRLYSVWTPIEATSVGRAESIFFKEVGAEEGWGKRDIVLIGVMPGGLTDEMKKDFVPSDEIEDEDVEDDEADPDEDEELDEEDEDLEEEDDEEDDLNDEEEDEEE